MSLSRWPLTKSDRSVLASDMIRLLFTRGTSRRPHRVNFFLFDMAFRDQYIEGFLKEKRGSHKTIYWHYDQHDRCILRGARLTSEAWIGSTKIVLYYMSAMREAGHVISIDRRKT